MDNKVKKITLLAMLSAVAFVAVAFIRIPAVEFLKYEPKDVVIVIGGFMYGPLAAVIISVIVALVEMVTISDTFLYGCIMNIISSCAFAGTASFIYKKHHSMKGAIAGLSLAVILTTAVMMLWNYIVTPLYMGMQREAIEAMLPTVFLPFNILKGLLNSGITLLIYKPVVTALRKARLFDEPKRSGAKARKTNIGMLLIAAFAIITGVLMILVLKDVI